MEEEAIFLAMFVPRLSNIYKEKGFHPVPGVLSCCSLLQ